VVSFVVKGRFIGRDIFESALQYKGGRDVSYGIWNSVTKEFVFGIIERTAGDAEERLFARIGNNARKWRFEARQIPGETLRLMQDAKRSYRCGHPARYGFEVRGEVHPEYGDPLDYVPLAGHTCYGGYVQLRGILGENRRREEITKAKARLLPQARATLTRKGYDWGLYEARIEWSVHYEVAGKNLITVGYKVYVPKKEENVNA
jgi:hypothetical protein